MLRTVLLKEKKQRLLTEVKTVEYYFALLSLGSSETFSELRWGGCPGSEHSGDNDDWGWGCHGTCALRTNGFHLIHQWAPLGTEGRKQFFFFFFAAAVNRNLTQPCPEFLHRKSLLTNLLRHRSPVGTLQRKKQMCSTQWNQLLCVPLWRPQFPGGKADPRRFSAIIPLESIPAVWGIIIQLSPRPILTVST